MTVGTDNFTQEELDEFRAMGVDLGELTPPTGEENAGGSEDQPSPAESDEATGESGAEEQQDQEALEGAQGEAPTEGQPDRRTVPYQALTQARELLKQTREREAAANQRVATATARMNALLEAQRERERANVPEMPNLAEDPEGYIQTLEQRVRSFEELQEQTQQDRAMDVAIEQDERAFMTIQPDLGEASSYYIQSRGAELLLTNTPQQAQEIMRREVKQMARVAWGRDMTFGELLYASAKARGYTKAAPAPAPRPGAAPAPVRTAAPSPAAVLEAQRQGKSASRSLSTGAAAPASELNAKALLDMTDDEFEATLGLGTKSGDANFQKLFG